MKWRMFTPVLMALASGVAGAQAHRYEVAAIKPIGMAPPGSSLSIGTNDGGRFLAKGASMQVLVQFAYSVLRYQIAGAPGWFSDEAYDIEARPEAPFAPTMAEAREMLRLLLAERFGLQIRRENREATVYNLVAAKGGPRIKPTTIPAAQRRINFGRGMFRGTMTVDALTQTISGQLERPIFNRTGLEGEYDIDLHWAPDGGAAADSNEPKLVGALDEQLGLKLESTKGSIETLVIVAVEKPTN